MPLRAKLIVLTLGLLTAALAVLGTASVLILRAALLRDADSELAAQLAGGAVPPRLPSDFVLQLRGPDGGLKQDVRSSGVPGPAIPADPRWLAARQKQPVTTGTCRRARANRRQVGRAHRCPVHGGGVHGCPLTPPMSAILSVR